MTHGCNAVAGASVDRLIYKGLRVWMSKLQQLEAAQRSGLLNCVFVFRNSYLGNYLLAYCELEVKAKFKRHTEGRSI